MSTLTIRLPDDTAERLKAMALRSDRERALAILDRLDRAD